MNTADEPLEAVRNTAFAKLGRNIVLFQRLESTLKSFYGSLMIEGSNEADLARRRAERDRVLASRSLGLVVKTVFDALGECDTDQPPTGQSGTDGYVRVRFGSSGPGIDALRARLEALIEERNQIVHHLDEHHELGSAEGLARLESALESQTDRIRGALGGLRELLDDQRKMRDQLSELIQSPAFHAEIELGFLQASALIRGMVGIGREMARRDGWTPLSQASGELRRRDPDAFEDLGARYGRSSVKALLLASGLFELSEEPTARGGTRVLYRPVEPGMQAR